MLISALKSALAASVGCTAAAKLYRSLLSDPESQSTYQPTLFRYFFLSFHLARAVVQSAATAGAVAGAGDAQAELRGCVEGSAQAGAGAIRLHPWITAELQGLV